MDFCQCECISRVVIGLDSALRIVVFSIWLLLISSFATADYSLDVDLGGRSSVHSQALQKIAIEGVLVNSFNFTEQRPNPVSLRCLSTKQSASYVGVELWASIDAPIERVRAVLENFTEYKKIFIGFDDIVLLRQDANKAVVLWEQYIPILPNIKYEMSYVFGQNKKRQFVYLFKLWDAHTIRFSDGVVLLEADGLKKTKFIEYDFFDANWGLLARSNNRIWNESVGGIYMSGVVVKLKAEHPDWSYEKIRAEAKDILVRFPVESAVKTRISSGR